jgi:hypothetical protein
MKKFLLILLLSALLISDVCSQRTKKKRIRHQEKKVVEEPTVIVPEKSENVEDNNRAELEAKLQILAQREGEGVNEIETYAEPEQNEKDPCADKRCGPGRECTPTEQGKAKCVCLTTCPSEEDNRRRVCSNYNETWNSDCELYRSRCLCDENSAECTNHLNKHLHIEYYGECREMPPCVEQEMSDFPRRMRDWLFNVMRELADRRELSPHYLQMEREAERSTNESSRSVVAAVWKWCDLDGHPHDRQVSRHELFPIRAPLMALEHCIAPFLDNCDADNDHRITLKEWGQCLEVPQEEMEEKCDDVREAAEIAEEGDEEV